MVRLTSLSNTVLDVSGHIRIPRSMCSTFGTIFETRLRFLHFLMLTHLILSPKTFLKSSTSLSFSSSQRLNILNSVQEGNTFVTKLMAPWSALKYLEFSKLSYPNLTVRTFTAWFCTKSLLRNLMEWSIQIK